MNLCIKRSDFNTAGIFLLGVDCSHHIREGEFSLKSSKQREQDDRGVGGCEAHLSPRIHQEHTFRHRSACRAAAESGQEDLTSGREYTEPRKTRQDEGTSGESRSVRRTGPALNGWRN